MINFERPLVPKLSENQVAEKVEDKNIKRRRLITRLGNAFIGGILLLAGKNLREGVKEEAVYNLVDNVLKQTEFKNGKYQGLSPVEVFNRFADMKENLLHIKDTVKQALTHSIYRVKNSGKIYEGEFEVAKDEDELVKYLADDDHQEDLITLEQKLKTKKLASV